ncbi:hypothetical protein M427DRAFT_272041 [Gonapodya prolifera JEL478]|uniref:Protein phosphatase 1 regulatory subunit 21 N-terminal domain-containing protein n=1 Tax=Gonapodya prolifera (strain JEL478) TaxID=1344416 RepID=A0A139AXR6_GONPJ|nr:hypothetical protein M427DRAFT_272041 [Gonapodya prolifera JEL478]|eukprot:KXS21510.1 hypothetical protein M427DRAFT_272041 [Gonapodya prolifera JEL478]
MSESQRSGATSPSPSLSPSFTQQNRRSLDGYRLALNYQRLLDDFGKVKAQNSVLKRAIIEEQNGTKLLQAELKMKEDEIRKSQEAHDISRLHNDRLTKQLKSLQEELAARPGSRRAPKVDADDQQKSVEQLAQEFRRKLEATEHLSTELRETKAEARNWEIQYMDSKEHLSQALSQIEDLKAELVSLAKENEAAVLQQSEQARLFEERIKNFRLEQNHTSRRDTIVQAALLSLSHPPASPTSLRSAFQNFPLVLTSISHFFDCMDTVHADGVIEPQERISRDSHVDNVGGNMRKMENGSGTTGLGHREHPQSPRRTALVDAGDALKDALSIFEQVHGSDAREEDISAATQQLVNEVVRLASVYSEVLEDTRGIIRAPASEGSSKPSNGQLWTFVEKTGAGLKRIAERLSSVLSDPLDATSIKSELILLLVNWYVEWEEIWLALQYNGLTEAALAAQSVAVAIVDALRSSSPSLASRMALQDAISLITVVGDLHTSTSQQLRVQEAKLQALQKEVVELSSRVTGYEVSVVPKLESDFNRSKSEASKLVVAVADLESKLALLETEKVSINIETSKAREELEVKLAAAREEGKTLRQQLGHQARQLAEQTKEVESLVAKARTKDEWTLELERTIKNLQRKLRDVAPLGGESRPDPPSAGVVQPDVDTQADDTEQEVSDSGEHRPKPTQKILGGSKAMTHLLHPITPIMNVALTREELESNIRSLTMKLQRADSHLARLLNLMR